MVKHTQTISRQQPTNSLSVFDHFVGVGALRVNMGLPSALLVFEIQKVSITQVVHIFLK